MSSCGPLGKCRDGRVQVHESRAGFSPCGDQRLGEIAVHENVGSTRFAEHVRDGLHGSTNQLVPDFGGSVDEPELIGVQVPDLLAPLHAAHEDCPGDGGLADRAWSVDDDEVPDIGLFDSRAW